MNEISTDNTALIWDLDGTLLDSYGIIVSGLYQTCEEFGLSWEKQDIYREIISKTVNHFVEKIESESGIDGKAFKERYSEINDCEKFNIKPISNAVEILEWLKNQAIRNYVFTHRGTSTGTVLKNTGLYRFFDDIVTGKDGFGRKPDPGAILYLIEKHNLNPEKTWYVGDRTIDIECAVNAGIKSILYLPPESVTCPNGMETFIILNLLDIKNVLPQFDNAGTA